ncbi:hypothetical protein BGX23_008691 [Mortierella sp. AD031]|nr:hypothetical protein BGX23_008691 [Mortierella sp. AD031]
MTVHCNPCTALFAVLVGVCLTLLIVPSAAQVTPIPVFDVSYTSISDKALFIRGGATAFGSYQYQFYSLELTPLVTGQGKPAWNTRNTQINASLAYEFMRPLCPTTDNATVLHFDKGAVARYTIADNTWSSPEPVDPEKNLNFDSRSAVMDPATGLVYIPQGNRESDTNDIFVYDPPSKVISYLKMYSSTHGGRKMIVFGGSYADKTTSFPSGKALYFNFVTNQWIDEAWINNATSATTVAPAVTSSSSPEPNLNEEFTTNNAAAIGGGTAAAVVFGVIIGILVTIQEKLLHQH